MMVLLRCVAFMLINQKKKKVEWLLLCKHQIIKYCNRIQWRWARILYILWRSVQSKGACNMVLMRLSPHAYISVSYWSYTVLWLYCTYDENYLLWHFRLEVIGGSKERNSSLHCSQLIGIPLFPTYVQLVEHYFSRTLSVLLLFD